MAKNNDLNFGVWNFVWAIIDTVANILVMVAVIILLAKSVSGLTLTLIIIIFILWVFRPMYLAFKEFFKKFPEKKLPSKKFNFLLFILTLLHYLLFFLSIIIFASVVLYLGQLVHPLVICFSLIVSGGLIVLYDHFAKKEKKSSIKIITRFFFFSSLILLIFVLFFLTYDLSKGTNLEPQNVSFDAYVVNNALSQADATSALIYSHTLWGEYNISIITSSISYKKVNLSSEEILFLFNNGSTQEECQNYSRILTKIRDNSTELSIIFLNNLNSGYAGRGCLCNCTFVLVSPEKIGFMDFTGWDIAHEIGHVLGLSDIQYYGRIKENLMNDETKHLLFFNSNFLDQTQVDKVINKIKSLNQ